MTLSLMQAYMPDMTQEDAAAALCQRTKGGEGLVEDDGLDEIPESMLDDVIKCGDRSVLRAHVSDRKNVIKKKHDVAAVVKKLVPKHFKQVEGKKAAGPAFPTNAKAEERWWSSIVGDEAFLTQYRPPGSHVFTDSPNGRFRVTYPGTAAKSYSWLKRGMEQASLEALRFLWDLHFVAKGEKCPINLNP